MDTKNMKQFAQEVLNTSGVRATLRQKVSQIDRLESLDSLRNLRLTRMDVGEDNPIFMAFYEAVASQDLYPHVRANLIKKGVLGRNNVLNSSIKNRGQADEYETVGFCVSGSSIQVCLKAYNPNYIA